MEEVFTWQGGDGGGEYIPISLLVILSTMCLLTGSIVLLQSGLVTIQE